MFRRTNTSFPVSARTGGFKSMAFVLDLPNELLIEILEYLDSAWDLQAVSGTCHRLHYVGNPILYSFAVEKLPHLLTWACEVGEIEIVRKLLVAGADPNEPAVGIRPTRPTQTGSDITDPLVVLYEVYENVPWSGGVLGWREHGDGQDITYQPGRNLDWYCEGLCNYWFPLHGAAISGSIGIIQLLVDHGAHIDPPSRELCHCYGDNGYGYWTPLHTAICSYNESTANFLLNLGASPTVELQFGAHNALHAAARVGFFSTMRLLIEGNHHVSVNITDQRGLTPLMWALGTPQSKRVIEYLFSHGAKVNQTRPRRLTALTQACSDGWHEDDAFLLDAGANIKAHETAALLKCLNFCGRRFSREAPPRESIEGWYCPQPTPSSKYGERLGHLQRPSLGNVDEDDEFAAMMKLMKRLIRGGSVISSRWRGDALVKASKFHLTPIVNCLLEHGAPVTDLYLILVAVCHTNVPWSDRVYDTVNCLLRHGADPNQADRFGDTALMTVCCQKYPSAYHRDVVKLLVDYGAEFNIRHSPRYSERFLLEPPFSPLEAAFCYGHYDICRYLVDKGAATSEETCDLRQMLKYLIAKVPELEEGGVEKYTYQEIFEYGGGVQWLNINLTNHRDEFREALRCLLKIDYSGKLTRDPESLRLAFKIRHFPLLEVFLNSGASDASWHLENEDSLMHCVVGEGFYNENISIPYVQSLLTIGADINTINGQGWSPLTALLHSVHSKVEFTEGGVERFAGILAVLVGNDAIQLESDVHTFKELLKEDELFYDSDFGARHRRVINGKCMVRGEKIVTREQ
ncbi:ankyrin [Hypoxylon trugodes]|uniref:ankyrin n=1 Tax=Hypoxylon trugodes TaxID=326681 RepID=UPI00219BE8CC|nr:ankyrin [Hypoxylon trugodes]KAI1392982.1 ankyrin [Hypoxylon trugodes]